MRRWIGNSSSTTASVLLSDRTETCGLLIWRPETQQTLWVREPRYQVHKRGVDVWQNNSSSGHNSNWQWFLPHAAKRQNETDFETATRSLRTVSNVSFPEELVRPCVRWSIASRNERYWIVVLLDSQVADKKWIEALQADETNSSCMMRRVMWRSHLQLMVTVKYERAHLSCLLYKVVNMLPCDRSYAKIPRVGVIAWDPSKRRVLLIQGHGNVWGLPKGGCESGESLHETAARELYEETSVTIPHDELLACVRIRTTIGRKSRVPHYFYIWTTIAPDDQRAELHVKANDEVRRAVWVSYMKLQQLAGKHDGSHSLLQQLCSWLNL